jgi:bacterioferritin-associated ferredoxin
MGLLLRVARAAAPADLSAAHAPLYAALGLADTRLRQLQAHLRCGTGCGSCVPALKLLVQQHPAPEAAAA